MVGPHKKMTTEQFYLGPRQAAALRCSLEPQAFVDERRKEKDHLLVAIKVCTVNCEECECEKQNLVVTSHMNTTIL